MLVTLMMVLGVGCSAGVREEVNALQSQAEPTKTADDGDQTEWDRSLDTFRQVDDFPLYTMTYYGDYGFSEFLKTGIESSSLNMPSPPDITGEACTTFAALNEEGDAILGRNFDWIHRPALLLFTDSPDGYASTSMVDIHYLGFTEGAPTEQQLLSLMDAPYLPFDGMNERGLAVGMMAVPYADLTFDASKITLDSLHIIRLILDYAQDVDEAITLMGQYNIDFGSGPELHYLIADASGESAIVEFLDGELVVLRNEAPWQVSTNFVFSDVEPEDWTQQCWRYQTATEALTETSGLTTMDGAMAILADTAQSSTESPTVWSVVYNMSSGEVQVVMGRAYDDVHRFSLSMAR